MLKLLVSKFAPNCGDVSSTISLIVPDANPETKADLVIFLRPPPEVSTAINTSSAATVDIADKLGQQLHSINGFTVNNDDYIIHIKKDDGSDYEITSKDDKTGEATKAIKGVVDDLDDLPIKGYEGFIVKVQGSQATRYDDYYVKFTINKDYATLGEFGDGVWKETVAPGIQYKFDEATMPHVLIRKEDGSFTFQKYLKGEVSQHKVGGSLANVTYAH